MKKNDQGIFMKISYGFLLVFMVSFVFSCRTSNNLLQNRSIVYSESSTDSSETANFNSYFIVHKADSFIVMNNPYGSMIDSLIGYVNLPYRAARVQQFSYKAFTSVSTYRLWRKGKVIYLEFERKNKKVVSPYYSLKKRDTIEIQDKNNFCVPFAMNYRKTVYSGKDTTINLYDRKFSCFVFYEYLHTIPGDLPSRVKVYLEKQSLVPMLEILESFLDTDFANPSGFKEIKRISYVIDIDPKKFEIGVCDY